MYVEIHFSKRMDVRKMKVKLNKLSAFVLSVGFIAILAASIVPNVAALTFIGGQGPNYSGCQWSGGGDNWSSSASVSGSVSASCSRSSYAYASVNTAGILNDDGGFSTVRIIVSANYASVSLSAPWGSSATAKWWVMLYDQTAGQQILFDNSNVDYIEGGGYAYFDRSYSVTIYNGHYYSISAGVWVATGYGYFGQYGTAQASGHITNIQLYGA
jgi:hypothetical protein